ncbi:MAG: cellulase family glycosylhydrolase [Candidatus Marinimicrobia bacterium]|nr:cellulase family glycosylhydrolase [Candidatus Neomarinimicrobiota bacterium]
MPKVSSYIILVTLCFSFGYSQGFLHTDGQSIVNGNGEEVILRGMGLGGWMLQEGYMMQSNAFASSQHELKIKIEMLVGTENMENFYNTWLQNHCQKVDVDSLATWGFNSIRLPMHYNLFTLPIEEEPIAGENTWLDKGFELTDSLLSWCASNEMYLILDLHAAPGGQGYESAISDYDPSKPSLWESAANRSKMVALWYKLAEHYSNEPWIGGYDLLNETNWHLPGNVMLKQLYQDITTVIRAVDNNHIIYIEGNWFANDFNGLIPPWDNNMVYSFHKYWSYNDQSSIQWMLDMRQTHNIPIWCGESGENSNVWFTDAITLLENNDIGWAWWPLKKIESIAGPLSITKTEGYQTLLNYWQGSGNQPTEEFGANALMELAEMAKLENCRYQKDVIDAMFRQVNSDEAKPFINHQIPGTIQAVDYDLGRNGISYSDIDVANYSVSTGEYTAWNTGFSYRNDGVDIEVSSDNDASFYNIGWIQTGEWVTYTVEVSKTDSFEVMLNVASQNGSGQLRLNVNGLAVIPIIDIPETGGWQVWTSMDAGKIFLNKGSNIFEWKCLNSGFNLSELTFTATSEVIDGSFYLNQNFPNPFRSKTKIEYYITEYDNTKLDLYNLLGQKVDNLVDKPLEAGPHEFVFDGSHLGSGIYYYRLKSGNGTKIKKMMLVK